MHELHVFCVSACVYIMSPRTCMQEASILYNFIWRHVCQSSFLNAGLAQTAALTQKASSRLLPSCPWPSTHNGEEDKNLGPT